MVSAHEKIDATHKQAERRLKSLMRHRFRIVRQLSLSTSGSRGVTTSRMSKFDVMGSVRDLLLVAASRIDSLLSRRKLLLERMSQRTEAMKVERLRKAIAKL